MNKKIVSRLLIAMTLVVIGMAAACMPAAATTTVSIDDASADSGATTTTPIRITDLTENLGAVEIVLTYDADVEVVSVSAGTMGDVTPGINNAAHTTTITWFSTTGKTGDQTFAQVELKAIGGPGEGSPLDLTVNEFKSTGDTTIAHVVDNGWFVIGTPNNPPAATVIYPNGGEVLDGIVTLNASATDTDGTIADVVFSYSANGGVNWTALGGGTPVGGDYYEYSWNTRTLTDGDQYMIKAVATDNGSATGEDTSDAVFTLDNGYCLALNEGWNFVSIPKRINGSNGAIEVFSLTTGETCLYYDRCAGGWLSNHQINVVPCQSYWVYKDADETICVRFDPGTGQSVPPSQNLCEGWNMIGHIDTSLMPINDGSIADFGSITTLEKKFAQVWQWTQDDYYTCYPLGGFTHMTPGQGYWILMTKDATMYGTL